MTYSLLGSRRQLKNKKAALAWLFGVGFKATFVLCLPPCGLQSTLFKIPDINTIAINILEYGNNESKGCLKLPWAERLMVAN